MRVESGLPMIHDDGHALIAAIYFLRRQKPISSELIRQYHARLDQALMDSL